MSILGFKYGNCGKARPRNVVSVVKALQIHGKYISDYKQAATSIAWIIANNLTGGNDFGEKQDMRDRLYKKARRRILPICKRILDNLK